MACETHCCVFTRGEFFISDWQSSCVGGLSEIICESVPKPYRKVGNVSSCSVNITAEILGKENKFNPLDETCARTMINGVQMTISFSCASIKNLYQAMYAEKLEDDSGRHVKDFCFETLEECMLFTFDFQKASEDDLVVTLHDAEGNLESTLVVDVDYKYTQSGIEILRDDIVIGDAVTLRIAYDYDTAGFYSVDFKTKYQGYKSIYFRGTNYGGDEAAVFDAVFHKVIFPPISDFDLITQDDFLTLTLSGSVEEDNGSWYKLIKQEE